jgi:hypothetical protein
VTKRAAALCVVLLGLSIYLVWSHIETRPAPRLLRPEAAQLGSRGEWQVDARFLGRVVGMGLGSEGLPTLPVGYDPRYQMNVEVLAIREGSLPVKPGARLGFLIHSPSLFFMRYLGRKPAEFGGYVEGPLEFTLVRKPSGEGMFVYDLRIEPPISAPSKPTGSKR